MASPQTQNGFLRVAFELAEALAYAHLTPNEWKIIWVIMRKTYGWDKPSDRISLRTFSEATGINRRSAFRAIKSLIKKGVVKIADTYILTYSIQKDYEKWNCISKEAVDKLLSKLTTGVVNIADGTVVNIADINRYTDNKQHGRARASNINIKEEIPLLRKMQWDILKIKNHFLMRGFSENDIDQALGKEF